MLWNHMNETRREKKKNEQARGGGEEGSYRRISLRFGQVDLIPVTLLDHRGSIILSLFD